jgi:APA family basic amino acid/polyamine antiporter
MGKLNTAGVPAYALMIQAVWSAILCLSGNYGRLLDYVMFAVILFYIVTIIGLFVLRVKKPNAERPYKALGYPFLPALYIILASAFCGILLVYKPENAWPGFIIVGLGAIVYFLFRNTYKQQQDTVEDNMDDAPGHQ